MCKTAACELTSQPNPYLPESCLLRAPHNEYTQMVWWKDAYRTECRHRLTRHRLHLILHRRNVLNHHRLHYTYWRRGGTRHSGGRGRRRSDVDGGPVPHVRCPRCHRLHHPAEGARSSGDAGGRGGRRVHSAGGVRRAHVGRPMCGGRGCGVREGSADETDVGGERQNAFESIWACESGDVWLGRVRPQCVPRGVRWVIRRATDGVGAVQHAPRQERPEFRASFAAHPTRRPGNSRVAS
jgi:hypothetical protein